ncbi:hypothetical protein M9H77_26537 [Catharanthus roseus]|uniref:Uncharacterized protein n=1 Tax=Catharanthus roseus TaxID=4058 RepID=A0ACC0AAB7_CATRO|nr:hypothetical protein M9H77_26537 [Catharanthus roseus]
MEVIHHVRVMLFWDSEIARDAYDPYFTGVMWKSWTLLTTQMISHNELVRKILKYRDIDPNIWIVRMTMRVLSYYEVHRMFYFNLYSINNDEEMHYLWTIPPHHAKEGIHILVEFEQIQQHSIPITQDIHITNMTKHITAVTQMDGDDAVSSQSESDDDNDPEGELQTPVNPVNPVTENIVPQWESSQWFSSTKYDYTYSGAFLDMGSGSPIDDLVESGTMRLLDWNNSITHIQLGMRL